MEFLKKNFSSIKLGHFILLVLLGLFLSLTINSIFIYTGFIKLSIVPSEIDDKVIYIITMLIRILTSCVIGPLIEEIVFRGFLFNSLSKRINVVLSALLTTIIFAVMHISISTCIFAIFTGLVFIYFYIKTNNLLVSFTIHSACNIMALVVLFVPISILWIIVYLIITVVLFISSKILVK